MSLKEVRIKLNLIIRNGINKRNENRKNTRDRNSRNTWFLRGRGSRNKNNNNSKRGHSNDQENNSNNHSNERGNRNSSQAPLTASSNHDSEEEEDYSFKSEETNKTAIDSNSEKKGKNELKSETILFIVTLFWWQFFVALLKKGNIVWKYLGTSKHRWNRLT